MTTRTVPGDHATIADAIAASTAGDTIMVADSATPVDTLVTVNNLTFFVAPNHAFTLTLDAGVTDITLDGAGEVDVVGNDAGNEIIGNQGANTIRDGMGDDIISGGQEEDVIFISGGSDAVDLGAFADEGQTNPSGGDLNATHMDTLFAFALAGGHTTVVNFTPEEDPAQGEDSDQIVIGGATFSSLSGQADFFLGNAAGSGQAWATPFTTALSDLGGYTNGSDWELTVAIDLDSNLANGYESTYTLHDLFGATQQTQIQALLSNTDFTAANSGGMSQIDAADEGAFISGVLEANTAEGVDFALLVDPSRDGADDGQIDLATGLVAFRTIQAALTQATVGDVLMLAPGDHTFGGTVPGVSVTVDSISLAPLQNGSFTLPQFALDTGVESFSSLMQTNAGVVVNGNSGDNDIEGDSGNDTIAGLAGNDTILGGGTDGGTDNLSGGDGDDTFQYVSGRSGTESIDGGSGAETNGDSIQFSSPGPTFDSITLSGSGAGLAFETSGGGAPEITATDIEGVFFSLADGQDSLTISGDLAAAGVDPSVSFGGVTADLGQGIDTFDASGLTSATTLNVFGGGGDDSLTGGAGNDFFTGGAQNDTINGGAGTDTAMYALASSNYQVTFNDGNGTYTVTALSGDEGVDTLTSIEQLAFDNGAEAGGIDSFLDEGDTRTDFDGDGSDDFLVAFKSTSAQMVTSLSQGNTFLDWRDRSVIDTGDFDGDGSNDFLVEFNSTGARMTTSLSQGNTFLDWRDREVLSVGDFDGDGSDDFLVEFNATGARMVTSLSQGHTFLDWRDREVLSVGDFDGDGSDDFLVEFNSTGARMVTSLSQGHTFLDWRDREVLSVGDFDGDGSDDFLVEFNSTGARMVTSLSQGNTFLDWRDRQVLSVGDFDGDGSDDFLVEFNSTGARMVTSLSQGNTFLDWRDRKVLSAGDYDGDGSDDFLVEFNSTGARMVTSLSQGNTFLDWRDRDVLGEGDDLNLGLTNPNGFEVLGVEVI